MIREHLSLNDILIGFENSLKIEYKEKDIDKIRVTTKQRLESTFQVMIVSSIYETQASNRVVGDNLSILMSQLTENMKSLALLLSISMFDKRFGETLKNVNYLGFAKSELLTCLKYLQDEVLYDKRSSFFSTLVRGAGLIEMCSIKRLLVIMVILEDLGVKEGVSLIAQYLYTGAVSK